MATPETVLVTGGSGFIAKEAPCGPCGRPCGSVSSGDETLTDIARLQRSH